VGGPAAGTRENGRRRSSANYSAASARRRDYDSTAPVTSRSRVRTWSPRCAWDRAVHVVCDGEPGANYRSSRAEQASIVSRRLKRWSKGTQAPQTLRDIQSLDCGASPGLFLQGAVQPSADQARAQSSRNHLRRTQCPAETAGYGTCSRPKCCPPRHPGDESRSYRGATTRNANLREQHDSASRVAWTGSSRWTLSAGDLWGIAVMTTGRTPKVWKKSTRTTAPSIQLDYLDAISQSARNSSHEKTPSVGGISNQ